MPRIRIPSMLDETEIKVPESVETEVEGTKKQIFGQRDCTAECVMALSLNGKKKTERIIIGEREQVELWLANCGREAFCLDVKRPLGTLLLEKRIQKSADWNQFAGALLRETLRDGNPGGELENEAWAYLEARLKEQDSVIMFTAYQCWSWYHKYRLMQDREKASQDYGNDFLGLNLIYDSVLNVFLDQKSRNYDYDFKHAWEQLQGNLRKYGTLRDQRLDIRYSMQDGGGEWVVITDSFYPMLQFYLKKLMEWDLCYCRCSVCRKMFLAPNKHYSLCSKACHTEQNRENKRQFDARAKKNGYDIPYKNTCQRMRNRLNKLKKQANIPDEKKTEMEQTFEAFRKEAVSRKKKLRNEEDRKEYQNWLFEQEHAFEDACRN